MQIRVALVLAALVAAVAVPRSAHAALETGVVDVTTNLAYQNGSAAGTGMVITASGEVLTNNHVIRGATTIRVTDPSTGRSYSAAVVGYSVTSDIAVLQLNGASHLHTIALGSAAHLKLGQGVTALGNAGGAGGKPASAPGKVTGLNQSIVASDGDGLSERLVGLIRTDAAIQPGDSGGPLLNAAGRVIGMNTAASAGFYFQDSNEAYAIPIGRIVTLARQIVAGHASATVHVGSTPFLGVSVTPGSSQGAVVVSVVSGAPADRAGIAAGDTITAIDGQSISSYTDLSAVLLRHNAGETVTLQWTDQTGVTQTGSLQTAVGPPQ